MTEKEINVEFKIGTKKIQAIGKVGDTLLDLKHKYNIEELECACEGSLACSTCHVIVDEEHYKLTGEVLIEEEDMLDLAYGLTKFSRLGCQIHLTPELNGAVFSVPSESRNFSHEKVNIIKDDTLENKS